MTDIMAQFTIDIVNTDEQDIVLKFVDGKSRPNEAEGLSLQSVFSLLATWGHFLAVMELD